MPLLPRRRRRASPKKIGPIGIGTGGLRALETDGEPAQVLPVRLAPSACAWPSWGLPATVHRFDGRTGLAAAPGLGRAPHVCSGSRLGSGAAGSMVGSQPAPGPPRARRGSQQRSASAGPSGALLTVWPTPEGTPQNPTKLRGLPHVRTRSAALLNGRRAPDAPGLCPTGFPIRPLKHPLNSQAQHCVQTTSQASPGGVFARVLLRPLFFSLQLASPPPGNGRNFGPSREGRSAR